MSMSLSYQESGRTRQKARTRRALIQAARELLAQGMNPTVEQAADAAEVSRATAYRYFPNQRALLLAVFPEIGSPTLLPDPAPTDPEARLDAVIVNLCRQLLEHEPELRAELRVALDPQESGQDLPLRTGRAIGWIEEALRPLEDRLAAADPRRLVFAIRTAVGIEALVWLTDVAGLSREEAVELMRWSASALMRGALAESEA